MINGPDRAQPRLYSVITTAMIILTLVVCIGTAVMAFSARARATAEAATPTVYVIPPTRISAEWNLRPTDLPLPTPTATLTLSPTLTTTAISTATETPTLTATPTETATASPTVIPAQGSPEPTRAALTNTPAPTSVSAPSRVTPNASGVYDLDSRYTGYFSNIGPTSRAIFERGRALGRNPHAIMRVGDSETEKWAYLSPFDSGYYDLGTYTYLQGVIDYFGGSFGHIGQAVFSGNTPMAILDPIWADKDVCQKDETPLECEIRTQNPAIALILTRTWVPHEDTLGSEFEESLREVVEYCIDQGVIPVLSTHLHHIPAWPPSEPINATIRRVANEYQIPLWDFYITSEKMPNRGNDDGNHLEVHPDGKATFFYGDYMNYAKTHHNLEALEVLHALMTLVIQP